MSVELHVNNDGAAFSVSALLRSSDISASDISALLRSSDMCRVCCPADLLRFVTIIVGIQVTSGGLFSLVKISTISRALQN